jgi:type I restriction enzyme M protein
MEKIVEDNLSSVDVALAELKEAWSKSLIAEEKFKSILQNYMQINIKEPNIT